MLFATSLGQRHVVLSVVSSDMKIKLAQPHLGSSGFSEPDVGNLVQLVS